VRKPSASTQSIYHRPRDLIALQPCQTNCRYRNTGTSTNCEKGSCLPFRRHSSLISCKFVVLQHSSHPLCSLACKSVDPWSIGRSLVFAIAFVRDLVYDRVAFLAKSSTQGPYDKALHQSRCRHISTRQQVHCGCVTASSPSLQACNKIACYCEPCAIIE
jgi:hypothetical protein